MVVKLNSKFAEVQYVEWLLKNLKPQVCFMCLSEIFSRFWQKYFSFRQACGNCFLCVIRIFLSNFFLFKNCFLSKLSSNINQKNFQTSQKKFCRISKFETSSLFYVSEWDVFTFLTELFLFLARLWKLNFMCHGEFWAIFFFSKNVCYQNCFQILSKKTFRFLKKNCCRIATILHPISFDEYSEVSFWRKSTLINVSRCEEKERETIWFYSKSLPFFLKTAFCFRRVSFAFIWNKFQSHN